MRVGVADMDGVGFIYNFIRIDFFYWVNDIGTLKIGSEWQRELRLTEVK